jgi:hypothetical protein
VQLDFALLADSAQVSEGKLFINGGGVSILWKSDLPAVMRVSLVLQLSFDSDEVNSAHELSINHAAPGRDASQVLRGQLTIGDSRSAPASPPARSPWSALASTA